MIAITLRPFEAGDSAAVHALFSAGVISLVPALFRATLVPPKGKAGVLLLLSLATLAGFAGLGAESLFLVAAILLSAQYLLIGRAKKKYADTAIAGDVADIQAHYRKTGGEFWVATVPDLPQVFGPNGRVVGIVGCDPKGGKNDGRRQVCELRRMSVDPHFQQRGIASSLVQKLEDFAREQGFARVELSCLSVQAAALALYKSRGFSFERAEALPQGVMTGVSEVFFGKDIGRK
jgi:ribosomal protein S18 acetylase RimI-like enzyme